MENGYSNHIAYFVHSTSIMSLTGHPASFWRTSFYQHCVPNGTSSTIGHPVRDEMLVENRHSRPRFRRPVRDGILFAFIATVFLWLTSCDDAKRYEISGNDSTPPGAPEFVESKPLAGGARIFFLPPDDEDLLYIEASYTNDAGKIVRFSASYFAEWVDVLGFGSAGEHAVELCAIDRAGNRSTIVPVTVEALEPPLVALAKSVQVLSSFSALMVQWINTLKQPLYVKVELIYTKDGVLSRYPSVTFNAQQMENPEPEIKTIGGLEVNENDPVLVNVTVSDKYDNVCHAMDTTINLLIDGVLDKQEWKLPPPGTAMGNVTQVNAQRMEEVMDGIIDTEIENFLITYQPNPWNLLIDLGEEYELSRVVTHQRWSGYSGTTFGVLDYRGNLYRGDNVLTYRLYSWNETAQTWGWLSDFNIFTPVVTIDSEYTKLGEAGDMSFIFPIVPQFSKPTRWLRFEAVNGKYISEITLHGRKAR